MTAGRALPEPAVAVLSRPSRYEVGLAPPARSEPAGRPATPAAASASASSTGATAPPGATHRTCSRVANREIERSSAGPNASANTRHPAAWMASNPMPLPTYTPSCAGAVVAVGDPVADVLDSGEREADHRAHDRQRPAADPSASVSDREPGPDQAGRAPGGHLPRRPRPLAEEEVRHQPSERPDHEARAGAERVPGHQHDVGRRLDVRQRGERDPPERRERGQRRHQRDDPRVRARALVPAEPGQQGHAQDQERAELPAHAGLGRGALARPAGRSPARGRPHAAERPCSRRERSAGPAQDPRRLGREVRAGGEDLRGRAVGDRRARRRAAPPGRRTRPRTRDRGWPPAPPRRGPRSSSARSCLSAPIHAARRLVEAHDGAARSAARDRRARPPARAAASRRPTDRAGGAAENAPGRARAAAAPRPRPPRPPSRGPGSRSGSGAAARPGPAPVTRPRVGSHQARRVPAAASTCRRRCGPSARPARRARPSSEAARRIAGPSRSSCHTRSNRSASLARSPRLRRRG